MNLENSYRGAAMSALMSVTHVPFIVAVDSGKAALGSLQSKGRRMLNIDTLDNVIAFVTW